MSDWREKLASLNKELAAQEQREAEQKASILKGFRKRLEELEAPLRNIEMFGEAFGVDTVFTISRFEERYPYLEFQIRKPSLFLRIECRDGVIRERLKEGQNPPREGELTLEALAPRRFEQRLMAWMQAAAEANRKAPGRRF
jgi:hypothetical protein